MRARRVRDSPATVEEGATCLKLTYLRLVIGSYAAGVAQYAGNHNAASRRLRLCVRTLLSI